MKFSISTVNEMDRDLFLATFGGVFEHSPWVAAAVYDARPFRDVATLHGAMCAAVRAADQEAQLALICAHPDLAGKATLAGSLTAQSTSEQTGAGLDRLSAAEYALFHDRNDAYRARFGFPFIIAVRGHTKTTILEAFAVRLNHDLKTERAEALREIEEIGRSRLHDLVT